MTIVCGLDTETTGLTYGDHRFVEVYAALYELETKTKKFEFFTRINPERSISADAERIHKISAADLVSSPTWNKVGPALRKVLSKAELLVAHNGVGFDMPFINYELERIAQPRIVTPCFDTMLEARWATPLGKNPNLGELCYACDVPYDPTKAHAADFDVGVMMECFFRGIDWGFFNPMAKHIVR
jgi:DNA polymerase III subunit epsilon